MKPDGDTALNMPNDNEDLHGDFQGRPAQYCCGER
jgi:hypothetical protein